MAEMSAEERRSAVLSMLESAPSVQVTQLAQAFGVSRVTVRGDLDALARDGKLRRTHGGAVSLSRTLTVSVQDRRVNVNVEAKRAIARRAARFVEDGDAVLVDSGTTALELVRALADRRGVTVVTADFTIADYVDRSAPALDVVMLGGTLRKGHRYAAGPLALRSMELLHPDKAFVTPTAYVPGRGLMTNYQAMAELKAAFLASAERTFVLMDATKVGASGLMWFGTLSGVDAVVMDDDPTGAVAQDAAEAGCELICCGREGRREAGTGGDAAAGGDVGSVGDVGSGGDDAAPGCDDAAPGGDADGEVVA